MRVLPSVLMVSLLSGVATGAPPERTVIEVSDPDFRPYPVAIPDVQGGPEAAVISEVLRWDLGVSPFFRLLDPKSYIANPKREGLNASSINFSDWLNVGAEGLVKARVEKVEGGFSAEFRLFDAASGRQLLAKTIRGADGATLGHRFSNAIVEFLTGKPGVFLTRIVAVKRTQTGRELVSLGMDGRGLKRVTQNGSINLLPTWSRDGKRFLFTSYIRHNPNLYEMPATGGRPRLLSGEKGLNTGGNTSPDGTKVALTLSRDGNSEIYLMNADGTGLTRLTNHWAIDSSPSFSPDGKRIAFVSSRWGDPHIFVMNVDGTGIRRLTERGTYNQTPDWSSRGDLIAFTARDERNKFDIFTVHAQTKEIARLTQDVGNNEEPSFSPDGNHVVFTSTREGRSQIWIMAWDGSNQRRITKGGSYSTPAWSPYLK